MPTRYFSISRAPRYAARIVVLTFLSLLVCKTVAGQNVATAFYLLPNQGGVGVGERLKMEVKHIPTASGRVLQFRAGFYSVAWSSSDATIAAVDQQGVVTGRRLGT